MRPASEPMNPLRAIRLLNELLGILCRSLPAYLADAKPWTDSANQRLRHSLDNLVFDRQRYAGRVSEAIVEKGGHPDPGRFPMSFTAKHDLDIDYAVQEILAALEQDIPKVEHCAAQLESVSALHALAEEILGNTRGHLEVLRETIGR